MDNVMLLILSKINTMLGLASIGYTAFVSTSFKDTTALGKSIRAVLLSMLYTMIVVVTFTFVFFQGGAILPGRELLTWCIRLGVTSMFLSVVLTTMQLRKVIAKIIQEGDDNCVTTSPNKNGQDS